MRNLLLIALLLMLTSPSGFAQLQIVTTTEDLASLAQVIGGEHVEVHSLTRGTRDPHYAQARPSMIRKVSQANLLILIGAELESGWLPKLIQSSRNAHVQPGQSGYLDTSHAINILGKPAVAADRSKGDVHNMGNPHYWLNPENGIKMANAITERLIALDATHAETFRKNQLAFNSRLETSIEKWKNDLAHIKSRKVLSYHNSLLYLASAFGLEIVDYVEPLPGISPGPSHIHNLIKTIERENIRLLIMEPYYEQRSAKLLARKTGIRVVTIPQSVGATEQVGDYITLFDVIVEKLKAE